MEPKILARLNGTTMYLQDRRTPYTFLPDVTPSEPVEDPHDAVRRMTKRDDDFLAALWHYNRFSLGGQ